MSGTALATNPTRIVDRDTLTAAAILVLWTQNGATPGDDVTFGNNDFAASGITITPAHILTGANGRKLNTLTLVATPPRFNAADTVLATRRSGAKREPLSIDSDVDLKGMGAGILAGTSGPFTAEIKAFDRHGNLLFSASRKSTSGDPIFLGVSCDRAVIAEVTYDIAPLDSNGLFINQLSVLA